MILYRCFAWDEAARPREVGGALFFPREFQGDGRHDNPSVFGCLYVTDREVSGVVERLASIQGSRAVPRMLQRRGLPLALAAIDVPDDAELVDFDNPRVLVREQLRPSLVATRERELTQTQALDLHARHPNAVGLRWWSTFEALWVNYTIFTRARMTLRLRDVRRLTPDDPAVVSAAEFLGLGD